MLRSKEDALFAIIYAEYSRRCDICNFSSYRSVKERIKISADQLEFNYEMSSLCVLLENNYREVNQILASKDYAGHLKVRSASVG